MHSKREDILKKLRANPTPYQEIRNALRIIGDKWSGLILVSLFEGPCRFTELETLLADISPRMLSQRLRTLEAFGLVTRHEYKEFPRRTEYQLTDKARDFRPVLRELKIWAQKYYD